MSSNFLMTSTSNEELNSIVDECNELTSCSVSKQSNKDERFFIIFLTYPLFLQRTYHIENTAAEKQTSYLFLVFINFFSKNFLQG